MYHPIIRIGSISQEKWADYIFSDAPKMVSCMLSNDMWKRQKAYKMNMIRQQYVENEQPIDDWFKIIQRLKWFRMKIRCRLRFRHQSSCLLNETNLMGEPWSEYESLQNYLDIHTEQGIIRYSFQDIIGILVSSLETREEFSPNYSIPKHPYTNTEWTLGEMYRIQGWLRRVAFKARNVPISVMVWIKTPYVVQTLATPDSRPYILHEYLSIQSKYNYLLEMKDRMVEEQELEYLSKVLTIQRERIRWNKVATISNDVWDMMIRPFILLWNHPLSEWMVDDTQTSDVRTIHWRNDLLQTLDSLGCIRRLTPRPRRVYRRRRIGRQISVR